MKTGNRVAFGGGCHWCTEAVFESLIGVTHVDQGWASPSVDIALSEAVLIDYDENVISLKTLLEIHLLTHSSMSDHSMRIKYRSAVYSADVMKREALRSFIIQLQTRFDKPLQTQVLSLVQFKSNIDYQNYYYQKPGRAFCRRYIDPKLIILLNRFSKHVKRDKVDAALHSDGLK